VCKTLKIAQKLWRLWTNRGTALFDSLCRINHGPRDFPVAPRLAILRPARSNAKGAQAGSIVGSPAGREGTP
jgi:hypothetical protein